MILFKVLYTVKELIFQQTLAIVTATLKPVL
jgi:hypothetical protein